MLERLASGLPNHFRANLLKACTPLSGANKQPPKHELRLWWKTAEVALLGMGQCCSRQLYKAKVALLYKAEVALLGMGQCCSRQRMWCMWILCCLDLQPGV